MNLINPNLTSAMMPKSLTDSINNFFEQNNNISKNVSGYIPDNLAAFNISPDMMQNSMNFDSIMDNVVNFKDTICYSQDIMAQMRAQGENLLALINRAHQDGVSQETLDAINAEVAAGVNDINNMFQNAQFNGINPLSTPFGVTIPNWQDIVGEFSGVENENGEEAQTENAITNLLTSVDFNFDFSANIDGQSFNMQASANIQIGFTEDGALQIAVDASMDFDLSGIVDNGAESDKAWEIINKFLNLLTGKQNDLYGASSLVDNMFGANNDLSIENIVPVNKDGNKTQFVGQLKQQAVITLDNAPYQVPNIAINML